MTNGRVVLPVLTSEFLLLCFRFRSLDGTSDRVLAGKVPPFLCSGIQHLDVAETVER